LHFCLLGLTRLLGLHFCLLGLARLLGLLRRFPHFFALELFFRRRTRLTDLQPFLALVRLRLTRRLGLQDRFFTRILRLFGLQDRFFTRILRLFGLHMALLRFTTRLRGFLTTRLLGLHIAFETRLLLFLTVLFTLRLVRLFGLHIELLFTDLRFFTDRFLTDFLFRLGAHLLFFGRFLFGLHFREAFLFIFLGRQPFPILPFFPILPVSRYLPRQFRKTCPDFRRRFRVRPTIRVHCHLLSLKVLAIFLIIASRLIPCTSFEEAMVWRTILG